MRNKDNRPIHNGTPSKKTRGGYKIPMVMAPVDPGATPVGAAERATFFKNLSEGGHGIAIDAESAREMLAIIALSPRTAATHVAVQDGNWSSPSTWWPAEVPGAGARVYIPREPLDPMTKTVVTYDLDSTVEILNIRLDGVLRFRTDMNTRLHVDTMVRDHGSLLEIGTEITPVQPQFTCNIVFPNTTDLNSVADPLLIGRGDISMGDTVIYGAAKTEYLKPSVAPTQGATTITFATAPIGWKVGDEIGVTATKLDNYRWVSGSGLTVQPYRDDFVTITGISGSTITVSPALTYSHVAPVVAGFPTLSTYIVNFTRNVTFSSPPGTPVHRRGHSMWMRAGAVAKYAAFNLMGRTRKDIPSWNATDDAKREELHGVGNPWPADANMRGRYNMHLHKAGIDPNKPIAQIEGCAWSDTMGWLVSQHSGKATFTRNVGRRFWGSGLVSEDGNENGAWIGNLIMHTVYTGITGSSQEKSGVSTNDFGRFGTAFWFKSRPVKWQNNIAASSAAGAVWMSRGISTPTSIALLDEPRIGYGGTTFSTTATITSDDPIIQNPINNEVICCLGVITVVKANVAQGHDLRSHFDNLLAWECQNGIELNYTSHYTFTNVKLHSCDFTNTGGIAGFVSNRALALENSIMDMVFVAPLIVGFNTGVVFDTSLTQLQVGPDVHNQIIDPQFVNVGTNYHETPFEPLLKIVSSANYAAVPLPVWVPESEPVYPNFDPGTSGASYLFNGTKTTKLDSRSRQFQGNQQGFDVAQAQLMSAEYGLWSYNGAKYLLVPDLISEKTDASFRYLTVIVRMTSSHNYNVNAYTVNGPLAQKYVDAIVANQWIVYEDILA